MCACFLWDNVTFCDEKDGLLSSIHSSVDFVYVHHMERMSMATGTVVDVCVMYSHACIWNLLIFFLLEE